MLVPTPYRHPLPAAARLLSMAVLAAASLAAHDEPLKVYSAASLASDQPVAPNSVAIVEGQFGDVSTAVPPGEPQFEVGSLSIEVDRPDATPLRATIFSVEPTRIRFLVPSVPAGSRHMTVMRGTETIADGTFEVSAVSPGLFSAANSGSGLADAQVVRVNLLEGTRNVENVAYLNPSTGAFEAVPLNPAAEGVVLFLKLRGTGIRSATDLSVTIAGVAVPANCGNEHGGTPGMDEVNIGPLPVQLAHRELADIALIADGVPANTVQVAFSPSAGAAITFSNQISRLFQENCQECHRPGEVARFPLIEYPDAQANALAIKAAVSERHMPPWKPVPEHGEFLNDRRLTDDQIEMIRLWVDAGAPQGNPADMPEPMSFNVDWTLGEPDLVLETPLYTPDPSSDDDYRCFSVELPASITESKSITGIEIRPGNRRIVHHLILYGDPRGESADLQAASNDGRIGYECFGSAGISLNGFTLGVESYLLGGWAPGARPQTFPEGTGIYVRPGSRIAIQMHYHPDGTEQSDSTRIGIHFADERTPRNASVLAAINTNFLIPAGAENYEVTAAFDFNSVGTFQVPPVLRTLLEASNIFPLDIINVAPHMHQLGREIRMDKVSASGEVTPMVYIDDWDFDWQDFYTYERPMKLHLDDRLEVRALYDNSASNPRNPNSPPAPVGWGERTTDEMCIVFFTVDIPDLCALPLGLCDSH